MDLIDMSTIEPTTPYKSINEFLEALSSYWAENGVTLPDKED